MSGRSRRDGVRRDFRPPAALSASEAARESAAARLVMSLFRRRRRRDGEVDRVFVFVVGGRRPRAARLGP